MAAAEKDQVFVEYVVKALVDNPDKVQITRSVDDRGVLLELSVDPEDMGKIIGKAGATAKSIRTLLRVLGAKDDARYNLKITEPEGSEHVKAEKTDEPTDEPEAKPNKDTKKATKKADAEAEVENNEEPAEAEEPATEAVTETEEAPEEVNTKAEDIKAKAREGIEDLDTDI